MIMHIMSSAVLFGLLFCFWLTLLFAMFLFKTMFMLDMDSDVGYSQATTTTGSHPRPSVQLNILLNIIVCPSMLHTDGPVNIQLPLPSIYDV